MKSIVEELDQAIASKLREAEAAGTKPDFTPEESARLQVLLQDSFKEDAEASLQTPVSVVRAGDAPVPRRRPGEIGTVLRLRDVLGTESFEEFVKRARSEQTNKDGENK